MSAAGSGNQPLYNAVGGDGASLDELLDVSKCSHAKGAAHGPQSRVSLFIAFCLMVNYIVGVGILETPYAFAQGGILLSVIATVVITGLMIIVVMYVLDGMARARGLANIYLLARIARNNELGLPPRGARSGSGAGGHGNGGPSGGTVPSNEHGPAAALLDGKDEYEPIAALLPYFGRARLQSAASDATTGVVPVGSAAVVVAPSVEDARAALKAEKRDGGEATADSLAKTVGDYMTAFRLASLAARDDASEAGVVNRHAAGDDLVQRSLKFDLDFSSRLTDALEYRYGAVKADENKMFELNELCSMFTPQWNAVIYEGAIFMMLYLALWSYASVFGNSFVDKFPVFTWGSDCDPTGDFSPNCAWSFRFWVLLYGITVISLSMYEVSHMLVFQVTLTMARFILIFLIFFATTIGLAKDPVDNSSTHTEAPYYGKFELFDTSGLITVISAVLFCELVTFGVPEIITPLKKRGDARKLLSFGMCATGGFYMLVGLTAALYFGDLTKSQINLNFDHYRGGAGAGESVPMWAQVVSYFVALFPALDVMSVFPLLAIALGNTLHARLSRYSTLTHLIGEKRLLRFCRLLASIPPVLGSLALRDISQIIKFASLPGVWIGFFAPPLLQYYSIQKCRAAGVDPTTPFSTRVFMSPVLMGIMIAIGFATYGIVIYSLATGH